MNIRRKRRLGKFVGAGNGDGRGGMLVGELQAIGCEVLLRVPEFSPGDTLTRMSGFTAKDRKHGAIRHVFTGVERLAFADGSKPFVVADLVHVGVVTAVGPVDFSARIFGENAIRSFHDAFFTKHAVFDLAEGIGELALVDVTEYFVRILEGDFIVILDVTVIVALGATATASCGDRFDIVHRPCDFIDRMDRLL